MKIVKEPDKVYKCYDCGCEFIPDSEDIRHGSSMKSGAFLGILPLITDCDYVFCPHCKNRIIIKWYNY